MQVFAEELELEWDERFYISEKVDCLTKQVEDRLKMYQSQMTYLLVDYLVEEGIVGNDGVRLLDFSKHNGITEVVVDATNMDDDQLIDMEVGLREEFVQIFPRLCGITFTREEGAWVIVFKEDVKLGNVVGIESYRDKEVISCY